MVSERNSSPSAIMSDTLLPSVEAAAVIYSLVVAGSQAGAFRLLRVTMARLVVLALRSVQPVSVRRDVQAEDGVDADAESDERG